MLRLTVKADSGEQCMLVVTVLNKLNLVLTNSKLLPDKSLSFLAVDCNRPFDNTQSAVAELRRKVAVLSAVMNATVEPYLEDCNGKIYCANCNVAAEYSISKDRYYCKQCGGIISIKGGGNRGR